MEYVNNAIKYLFSLDCVKKDVYVQGLMKKGIIFDSKTAEYEIFKSVVHLVFTYMVGYTLLKTTIFGGSTAKNAVPFMSKMSDMRDIVTLYAPTPPTVCR